ncbi:hypothetical protein JXA05_02180, partial [Candidatus Peregrinibacteria bacterium]|nr:hypothetical protein [Candidatus Peregrinibacteria bacterium]
DFHRFYGQAVPGSPYDEKAEHAAAEAKRQGPLHEWDKRYQAARAEHTQKIRENLFGALTETEIDQALGALQPSEEIFAAPPALLKNPEVIAEALEKLFPADIKPNKKELAYITRELSDEADNIFTYGEFPALQRYLDGTPVGQQATGMESRQKVRETMDNVITGMFRKMNPGKDLPPYLMAA